MEGGDCSIERGPREAFIGWRRQLDGGHNWNKYGIWVLFMLKSGLRSLIFHATFLTPTTLYVELHSLAQD